MSYEKKKSLIGYGFISPWLLGVALFFAYPFVLTVYYCFNTLTLENGGFQTSFDGLRHFRTMFTGDPEFLTALGGALVNLLYTVPLIVLFSLLIGVLLNQKIFGRTLYRAIFFLPVIVTSGVVLSILSSDLNSSLMLGEQASRSNSALMNITVLDDLLGGLGLRQGLADGISKFVSQTINVAWYAGVQILLVLAGLQSVSPSLYEAARIEGATKWDEFWKITFPMLMPILFVNILYSIIDSFTREDSYSYASAMSVVYSVIILLLIGAVFLLIGRRILYTEK